MKHPRTIRPLSVASVTRHTAAHLVAALWVAVRLVAVLLVSAGAITLSGCSSEPGTSPVERPTVTASPGQDDLEDSRVKEALAKFLVTADYIVAAAANTAMERGSEQLSIADLNSGIFDYGITEDPSIWTVVEEGNGFGLAAPVYGLGVCGFVIDAAWKQRPGIEALLEITQCTGTATGTPNGGTPSEGTTGGDTAGGDAGDDTK